MSTHFDHYFWQLRELQRAIDQLQPQLRALASIPSAVGEQIDYLASIRDRYTLPPDYLSELSKVREAIEANGQVSQLKALAESDNQVIREFVERQRELEDLSRRLTAYSDLSLPSQRVLETLTSTEALVETARLHEELIATIIQPQVAFQEFAREQLVLTFQASEAARTNRLMIVDAAADLLAEMSSAVELAALMSTAGQEVEETPRPIVNVFAELTIELEDVDLENTEADIEDTVHKSKSAQVGYAGTQIVRLVYDLNAEAEREGKSVIFKPTNKTLYSCSIIPTHVATDERSFSEIVDQLYFLLYEGSGAAARLTEERSASRLEALWRVKHLRLGFRHDVDHGSAPEAAKKNRQVGEAFSSLLGKPVPRSRADWVKAQIALYDQLIEMLKAVWFEDEKVSPTNAAILTFLDHWSCEPDDKGEEWWAAFEEELEKNREFREREIEHGA